MTNTKIHRRTVRPICRHASVDSGNDFESTNIMKGEYILSQVHPHKLNITTSTASGVRHNDICRYAYNMYAPPNTHGNTMEIPLIKREFFLNSILNKIFLDATYLFANFKCECCRQLIFNHIIHYIH